MQSLKVNTHLSQSSAGTLKMIDPGNILCHLLPSEAIEKSSDYVGSAEFICQSALSTAWGSGSGASIVFNKSWYILYLDGLSY
jgi:hypothetical protein